MARAVKTMATRVTKKARGSRVTRVRVTRVMMETFPREEGDDGPNNQLVNKAAAMARTVVATTVRAITMAERALVTGAKRAMATTAMTATMATTTTMRMAMMVMMATMTPNGKDDNENQAAMAARVIMTVARATVIGEKRAMAIMVTTATMAITAMTVAMGKMGMMMPNSDDAASGNKGNEDTKQ
jgi:hypothetical protein